MAKTRPVVIVSLDELNGKLKTLTVCPFTTQLHPTWRTRLAVRVNGRDGEIAVDHIRSISKDRMHAKVGALSDRDAGWLRRMITEMYGE